MDASAQNKEPVHKQAWLLILALPILLIALWVQRTLIPATKISNQDKNEVNAVALLRDVHSAAVRYKEEYGAFPHDLTAIGPPESSGQLSCHAANLRDRQLASKASGYRFEFEPGPPSEKKPLPGCPSGAKSFVIIARPLEFGITGTRSFFMDQTGICRATHENRAPILGR